MPRIPYDYQEVEYLQTNGSQYIDTDFQFPDTDYTELYIEYSGMIQNGACNMTSATTYTIAMYGSICYVGSTAATGNFNYLYDSSKHSLHIKATNGRLTYQQDQGTMWSRTYPGVAAGAQGANYLLFARWEVNFTKQYAASGSRIYRAQLFSADGVIERDFIPCYRKSDQRSGMYDLISERFFSNAASDSSNFAVGPNVIAKVLKVNNKIVSKTNNRLISAINDIDIQPGIIKLPSEYKQVEYLECFKNQDAYIKISDFVFNENFKFKAKWKLKDTRYNYNSLWCSSRDGDNYESWVYSSGQLTARLALVQPSPSIIVNNDDVVQYEFSYLNGVETLKVNDKIATADLTHTYPSNYFIVIGSYNGNTPGDNLLYYFNIYQNRTISHNLIPCYRKADQQAGLFNTINNIFYPSVGYEIGPEKIW